VHPASAIVAAAFVLWLVVRARRADRDADDAPSYKAAVNLVLALLGLQFALGVADVLLLAPTWMQVLHLLGADLYWVALVVLAAKLLWPAPMRSLASA
jgi:cytochrome c oxidase assembly protein subunit 15